MSGCEGVVRKIGLDVGEKYIGVAISGPLGKTAQGLSVISEEDIASKLGAIKKLSNEYNIDEIVVGMPLNMNGSEGTQAKKVRKFVKQLRNYISVPITFYDERMTTILAERKMSDIAKDRRTDAALKRTLNKRDKRARHEMAATIILQDFLDSNMKSKSDIKND